MTPERLNELAEMIEHDEVTVKEGREIAAFLRECAKAEPVAELVNEYSEGHGYLCRHIKLLDMSLPDGTKFYTHPPKQEQSPIDERAEFEKSTKLSGVSIKNDTARNIDGDYYSLPVQYAWEGWQAARKLPAPVVPDELKEICGLIARIFFYGNFVAETYNERELEKLLRKNGYFAESEDELMEIIQRLPSRNA